MLLQAYNDHSPAGQPSGAFTGKAVHLGPDSIHRNDSMNHAECSDYGKLSYIIAGSDDKNMLYKFNVFGKAFYNGDDKLIYSHGYLDMY